MKIRLIAVGDRKLTVIKAMRHHLGFDLRGAKNFVEGAPVTFDASKELYDELTGDFLRRHGCVVINEDADEDADEEDYEEKSDYDYLCILAERLRHIPGTYGTDGGDVDRVLEIARKLKPKPGLDEVEPDAGDGCSYCDATAGDHGVTFYFEGVLMHWHDKIICGGCVKKRQSA